VWSRLSSSNSSGAGGTNALVDLLAPLEVAGASHLGVTCGPVKFNLNGVLTGTPTAGGPPNLFKMGIIVGPVPANITTIADWIPSTHPEYDWMWINTFYFDQNAGAVLLDRTPDKGYFEARSRRRVEELNQTLLCVIEIPALVGATNMQLNFNFSTLVLLP